MFNSIAEVSSEDYVRKENLIYESPNNHNAVLVYGMQEVHMCAYYGRVFVLKKIEDKVSLVFDIKKWFITLISGRNIEFSSDGRYCFIHSCNGQSAYPLLILDFQRECYTFYDKPNFRSYIYKIIELAHNKFALSLSENLIGDNYNGMKIDFDELKWFGKDDINDVEMNYKKVKWSVFYSLPYSPST